MKGSRTYTRRYSLDQSTELWKYLYLNPDLEISFGKLTAQIGDRLH